MQKFLLNQRKSVCLNDIEHDGRMLGNVRDPPGQSSVYIPPGNAERETYRITTFKDFPPSASLHPCVLAASGFFYTGYRDRVKCYSCGQAVDSWQVGDDPTLRNWHKDDCDFINGTCRKNVAVVSFFRASPPRNQLSVAADSNDLLRRPRSPRQRAADVLITQSSHVGMGVSSNQSATRNQPGTCHQPQETRQQEENGETSAFSCLRPVNPHMRSKEARLQTFLDHSTVWPAQRIRATPKQIVDAGMYYLGNRDRVKCWYCNGGLQNWERDDEPWEEHAKWFPMCEYVIQQKGPEYVHRIVSRFPGLRRPTLSNPAPSASTNSRSSDIVTIVDPKAEINKVTEQVERDMTSCERVAHAKIMGFSHHCIRSALKRQYLQKKQPFSNFESLVDAILEIEKSNSDNNLHMNETPSTSSGGQRSTVTSAEGQSSSSLDELQELELSRNCKKCRKEVACVVFIPCGHLSCCVRCGEESTTCPVCKEFVSEKVRSYIS